MISIGFQSNLPKYNSEKSQRQGSQRQGKLGKVREKYFFLESQGISIVFVESQGKSGNFDLALGEPNFVIYF